MRAELNAVRLSAGSRSALCVAEHVIIGTYSGGADRVRVQAEGDASYEGPKRIGAAGIIPAGRTMVSEWPASDLCYVALFIDPAASDDVVGGRSVEVRTKASADDAFLSQSLLRLGVALERRDDDVEGLLAETIATALHVHMLQRFAGRTAARSSAEPGIERAIERIHDTLPRAASLQELASVARLPRARFLAAFRARTGMSPHQYIVHARLTQATTMLAASARTIDDVARACGFTHAAHLSTAFRQRFGRAPGEWRREQNRF